MKYSLGIKSSNTRTSENQIGIVEDEEEKDNTTAGDKLRNGKGPPPAASSDGERRFELRFDLGESHHMVFVLENCNTVDDGSNSYEGTHEQENGQRSIYQVLFGLSAYLTNIYYEEKKIYLFLTIVEWGVNYKIYNQSKSYWLEYYIYKKNCDPKLIS